MNTRAIAAKIIYQVIAKHESLDRVLPLFMEKKVAEKDHALLQEICYGTLRWYHRLDAMAQVLLRKETKKLDSLVHALLLIGLYQLNYLRVPEHAALAETVSAARVLQKNWATTLINAILREFLRDKNNILKSLENNLVAKYSHPLWLIEKLRTAWPKEWQTILEQNNQYPPMHLRVNLANVTRDNYLQKLTQAKIRATIKPQVESGITLDAACDVSKLPGFNKGLVSVQDLAAQYAATLLELKPGLRVLDACAAPGGKSAHILETEPRLAELVALDISAERLVKISANLQRLDLHAKLVCGDASEPATWWDGKQFERILLDAPCSATGVIRRHPDIKILRKREDIEKLAGQQLSILEALWSLLAPNGILVYATCSILPEENTQLMMRFLQEHKDARELSFTLPYGMKTAHGWQIFPEAQGPDGFFYITITKNEVNCA